MVSVCLLALPLLPCTPTHRMLPAATNLPRSWNERHQRGNVGLALHKTLCLVCWNFDCALAASGGGWHPCSPAGVSPSRPVTDMAPKKAVAAPTPAGAAAPEAPAAKKAVAAPTPAGAAAPEAAGAAAPEAPAATPQPRKRKTDPEAALEPSAKAMRGEASDDSKNNNNNADAALQLACPGGVAEVGLATGDGSQVVPLGSAPGLPDELTAPPELVVGGGLDLRSNVRERMKKIIPWVPCKLVFLPLVRVLFGSSAAKRQFMFDNSLPRPRCSCAFPGTFSSTALALARPSTVAPVHSTHTRR